MTDRGRLPEMAGGLDPADDRRVEEHAVSCPACARQMMVDQELRDAFGGLAQPALSPHFARELRAQLQADRSRRTSSRRSVLLMQGYWVAAAAASLCVLLLTRWPSTVPSMLALSTLGTILAGTGFAIAILVRSLRTGLVDLILGTIQLLRR